MSMPCAETQMTVKWNNRTKNPEKPLISHWVIIPLGMANLKHLIKPYLSQERCDKCAHLLRWRPDQPSSRLLASQNASNLEPWNQSPMLISFIANPVHRIPHHAVGFTGNRKKRSKRNADAHITTTRQVLTRNPDALSTISSQCSKRNADTLYKSAKDIQNHQIAHTLCRGNFHRADARGNIISDSNVIKSVKIFFYKNTRYFIR